MRRYLSWILAPSSAGVAAAQVPSQRPNETTAPAVAPKEGMPPEVRSLQLRMVAVAISGLSLIWFSFCWKLIGPVSQY